MRRTSNLDNRKRFSTTVWKILIPRLYLFKKWGRWLAPFGYVWRKDSWAVYPVSYCIGFVVAFKKDLSKWFCHTTCQNLRLNFYLWIRASNIIFCEFFTFFEVRFFRMLPFFFILHSDYLISKICATLNKVLKILWKLNRRTADCAKSELKKSELKKKNTRCALEILFIEYEIRCISEKIGKVKDSDIIHYWSWW